MTVMRHNGVHAFMAEFFTEDGRPSRGAQKDIASFVGVSSATVSRWFAGSTTIDPKHWKLLAQCAGTDVATLRGYVEGEREGVGSDGSARMLTEILAEIRNHRRSDEAPSGRLMDMPTRGEISAEIRAALMAFVEQTNENTRNLAGTVATLASVVEELEKRLPVPEAPPPAPAKRPARRKDSPPSRTSRNGSSRRTQP